MIRTKSTSTRTKPEKIEKTSLLRETLQRMVKGPGAKVGTILFALIVLACVCAPLIAPYGPNEMDLKNMYATPSSSHWLGTDGLGRDLLSRLLYGGRYSLALGLSAALNAPVEPTTFGVFRM